MSEDRIKFIEYITGLAADNVGETALVVRQKPQYDSDGNMIYHADDVPKATFPAFLPKKTARIRKKARQWYVQHEARSSLTVFIDGNATPPKGSNVEYVLFMMRGRHRHEIKRAVAAADMGVGD